jgi:hypothetical protein
VPSDLSRNEVEVKEEGNLLIEAVSLLVQRQRETESWVAEQMWQADERAAATDRRYAELEARLEGIEEHLARLVHHIEPMRGDADTDERLARLREQVAGLKSESTVREPESARPVLAVVEPHQERPAVAAPAPAPATAAGARNVTFWDVLGRSPQDRFGLLLMGVGVFAVLYAVLSQLRFS